MYIDGAIACLYQIEITINGIQSSNCAAADDEQRWAIIRNRQTSTWQRVTGEIWFDLLGYPGVPLPVEIREAITNGDAQPEVSLENLLEVLGLPGFAL